MKHGFNQDRENWLLELESGRRKQGSGALKETFADADPEYCCLGVMCELAGVALPIAYGKGASYGLCGWEVADDGEHYNTATPPKWLVNQLGFTPNDITLFVELNDSHRWNFQQIAAVVRFADEKKISLARARDRLAKAKGWNLVRW